MTTINDFFSMPEADVRRDEATGGPKLVPRGVDPASDIRAVYTRASYMADFLEKKDHIHKWEMRYLAKAMGQNEDLAALAACERYSTGVSDAVFGREKTQSGRNLDLIIERALDRVRIHEKADRGTSVHGFTEPGAPDGDAIPERLRAVVASFWETLRVNAIRLVATEQFTANDITMSAGTFDHLVEVIGHPTLTDLVVADKKTGRFSPFEWAVQISTYANGDPYDTETDQRPAWPGPINKDWGLVFFMDAEKATTELYLLDLQFGWRMAQLAAEVRDGHARTDISAPLAPATFEQRLAACMTRDHLEMVWYTTDNPSERARIEEKARTL